MIAGDVRLHAAEQGAGPLVLLIHGFPETFYSWRALGAAGTPQEVNDLLTAWLHQISTFC